MAISDVRRILVVARHDPQDPIGTALRAAGYAVSKADNGPVAIRKIERTSPDIVVADHSFLTRGASESLAACTGERAIPLLMIQRLETLESVVERVRSLDGGRSTKPSDTDSPMGKIAVGDLVIDTIQHVARLGDGSLDLTRKEFDLLSHFARRPDRLWSRHELVELLWGYEHGDDRVVSVHIANLRGKLARVAPGAQFIGTVRGVGYQFLNPPLRAGAPGSDSMRLAQSVNGGLPLVGREHELDLLRQAVEEMTDGRVRAAAIVGDAGIGKTRLADELAAWARQLGVSTYWGKCREVPTTSAYRPWIEILKQWEQEALDDGTEPVFAPQAIREAGMPAEGAGARLRLFERLSREVQRRAEAGPVCLIIDDLHWAGTSTLLALRHLIHNLREIPVILLVTYRPSEAANTSLLTEVIADLARSDQGLVLELAPLSKDEVGRFVSLSGCRDASPELTERVYRETEGNPLFLTQLMRLLTARNGSEKTSPEDLVLGREEGVRRVVLKRLSRLSPQCRDCLDVASVIGREFTGPVLAQAMDLAPELLTERLTEAIRSRIVLPQDGVPGRYRFVHGLFRQVAYDEIAPRLRATLHAKVGLAIEKQYVDEPDFHSAELAHHFSAASEYGYAERAVDCCVRAGRAAESHCAWEEACTQWRRALSLLELLPPGAPKRDWRFATEVYEDIAAACAANGKLAEAISAYQEAIRRVPMDEKVHHARVRREQSFCFAASGQRSQAEAALMEAEAILGPAGKSRDESWWSEWLDVRLERRLPPFYDAELDELEAVARQVGEAVEKYGNALQKARFTTILWLIDLKRRRFAGTGETVALAQDIADKYAATGSPRHLYGGVGALAMTYVLSHEYRKDAWRHVSRHLEVANRTQDMTSQLRALWSVGIWHRLRGEVEETRANALQTLSLIGDKPIARYGTRAHGNLSWVAWRTGDYEQARSIAAQGLAELEGLSPRCSFEWHVRWTLLALDLLDGDRDGAAKHAQALFHPSQHKPPDNLEDLLNRFVEEHLAMSPDGPTSERLLATARGQGYL